MWTYFDGCKFDAGIPALIQEQNAIPGVTNKILARFVDKIAVGYKRALSYFPENKVVFTGNPIRDDILLSTEMKV